MGSWEGSAAVQNEYGFADFIKFAFPFMWKGGCGVKFVTILTFTLLILSRLSNILHPLILGRIVGGIACTGDDCPDAYDIYFFIGLYAATKFLADFLGYLRELPFVFISANAEKHIAKTVYSHVQN